MEFGSVLSVFVLLLSVMFADSLPPNLNRVGSQFLVMASNGNYQYGYNDGHSIKTETRSTEGVVEGFYKYLDANKELRTVQYTVRGESGLILSALNKKATVGIEVSTIPSTTTSTTIPNFEYKDRSNSDSLFDSIVKSISDYDDDNCTNYHNDYSEQDFDGKGLIDPR